MNEIADDKADKQSERRDDFEVQQRFAADAANFFHVLHAGDAGDYSAENDQRNDHCDEANETIAQRLHCDGLGGTQIAERYSEGDRDEDLYPEICVERLLT